ncbi:MAG: hypothetical protein JSR59_13865 [Proteobacteria bacterium]|nr:hypothetical protein [Pseudomonadota bacterium]
MTMMRPLAVFGATVAATAWLLSRMARSGRAAEPAVPSDEADALRSLLAAQQEARRDAESVKQALDELLHTLGHDLRTPLGALVSATDVLKQAEPDSPLVPKALAIVSRQTSVLSDMVATALDVAGVVAGSAPLRRQPADLARLVDDALAALPDVERARLRVERLEAVPVDADTAHLGRVVSYLLGRALRGVRRDAVPEIALQRAADEAVLTVMLHDAADRAPASGRGLALARRIAALHGGSLGVEATSAGPALALHLPALDARGTPHAATAPATTRRAASRSIVVVDAAGAAAMLEARLIAAGHEVRSAHDGAAGLALISRARPDVAIVGLDAADIDAIGLARRARAAGYPGLMVATADAAQAPDLRTLERAGFDARLDRPLDLERLHALASTHL